jgi:hypothetical protein
MKTLIIVILGILIAGCNNNKNRAPILVIAGRPAIRVPQMKPAPYKSITLQSTPGETARLVVAERHQADAQIKMLNLIVNKCADVQN